MTARPGEGTVWVSDCGWQTVTTKSMINTIIVCFTRHNGITQRKGEWLQMVGDGAYAWKGHAVFPLALNADSWMLQQAEKLAS